jgi:hypothetical protein
VFCRVCAGGWVRLENRCGGNVTEGSNPSLSAPLFLARTLLTPEAASGTRLPACSVRPSLHLNRRLPVASCRIRTQAGCAVGVCAGVCAEPPAPGALPTADLLAASSLASASPPRKSKSSACRRASANGPKNAHRSAGRPRGNWPSVGRLRNRDSAKYTSGSLSRGPPSFCPCAWRPPSRPRSRSGVAGGRPGGQTRNDWWTDSPAERPVSSRSARHEPGPSRPNRSLPHPPRSLALGAWSVAPSWLAVRRARGNG